MKKTLLIIACLLIGTGLYQKYNLTQKIDIIPDNIPVIPEPIVPKPEPILETNIIDDNLELSQKLSIQFNRKLVIIFSANWCPYCHKLKNDLIKLDTSKYIMCIVDVDKNKELAAKYKLKVLPTSILLDNTHNEKSRKIGYIHDQYKIWLDSN